MSRRPASITQADVAPTIRAAKAAGLKIVRIVTRADGVAIETDEAPPSTTPESVDQKKVPVL